MFSTSPKRAARYAHEQMIMLALMIVVCIAVIHIVTPAQGTDLQPLSERLLSGLLRLMQCFGIVLLAFFLLLSIQILKRSASRYQTRQVEKRRERIEPLLRDASGHATAAEFTRVARLLGDANDGLRRDAYAASFAILRRNPTLAGQSRAALERALLDEPGFPRTLFETPLDQPLLPRVTLGAKLGAGSADKRLAPPTSDPADLASWIELHRRHHDHPEVQISIGYDTGTLPFLRERSRFVGLCLFIATTDLQNFQALVRRPPRDPNAAYGLVIRGDVVEVRYPGQSRGHRLDYVFPLPTRLNATNMAGLIGDIQLVNLGLLLACADDSARVLLGALPPTWLDDRRRAVAAVYRSFERRLVALLRRFDHYRDPGAIYPLVPSDHTERVRAFCQYRLEECLYPQYSWVVPLYDPDTRWDRLLDPLRAVEGMLLHKGGDGDTRGTELIREVRTLGYNTARSIEQTLAGEFHAINVPPDPFLDPAEEQATRHYLERVGRSLRKGEAWPEELPDPEKFRRATEYYGINDQHHEVEVRHEEPSP